jgi:hypothetical protein
MFFKIKRLFGIPAAIILMALPVASAEPNASPGPIKDAGADSLNNQRTGNLSCDVERVRIEYHSLNTDSVVRKTIVTLLLKGQGDSTQFVPWSERMTREKTDTLRLDQACIPGSGNLPVQKNLVRGWWRRWVEPSLAIVTLSGLVYMFYSVRSK